MPKPEYDVYCVTRKDESDKDEKGFWTRIGRAFPHEKGYNILLNALPTNGKLVLLEPREDEEQEEKPRKKSKKRSDDNDVPF